MDEKPLGKKFKEFWINYETKIILVLGFILVAIISFEVGALKGINLSQKPLVIEKASLVKSGSPEPSSGMPSQAQNLTSEPKKDPTSSVVLPQNCMFVGSKNSNKYHLPTCRYAKSINPENRVCFSSLEEAQSKGYVPDKNCIK